MPIYIYRCRECDHEFETSQAITADPLRKCPECEEESLRKVINFAPGISFQGPGYYVNDSRGAKGSDLGSGPSGSTPSSGGKKTS